MLAYVRLYALMSAAALDCRLASSRCLRRSSISILHRSQSSSASATICRRMLARSSSKEWMMESAVTSVPVASKEPPLTFSRLTCRCRQHGNGIGTSSAEIWIDRQEDTTIPSGTDTGSGAIVVALLSAVGQSGRILNPTQDVLADSKSFASVPNKLEAVLSCFCATHQEIDG